jgi:spectinomycin phosphotransferase
VPHSAADFADVFTHFHIRPTQPWSCYPWAPVFPAERDGSALVLKRASSRTPDAVAAWCGHLAANGIAVVTPAELPVANPAIVDRRVWVVYPWIAGRRYDAGPNDGERLPRLLDLALAVLLFHTELDTAPGRLFTIKEWTAFRDAYLAHVTLTEAEYTAWPDALDYQLWEEGTWAIEDSSEWHVERQRALLVDLAGCSAKAYPLR